MTREQEQRCIRRVLAGDSEAFEPLVTEHQKNAYNLALRMLSHPQDAEDVTQEAFFNAYRSLADFRGGSRFSSWLCRIVSNLCLDRLRSRARRAEASLTVENDEGEAEQLDVPDESYSPEALLERRLTGESVQRGLESLSPELRQILLLREIRGMSYEEIAAELSLEIGTVKSRIFRARKRLCAFLLQDGNLPDPATSSLPKGGKRP